MAIDSSVELTDIDNSNLNSHPEQDLPKKEDDFQEKITNLAVRIIKAKKTSTMPHREIEVAALQLIASSDFNSQIIDNYPQDSRFRQIENLIQLSAKK